MKSAFLPLRLLFYVALIDTFIADEAQHSLNYLMFSYGIAIFTFMLKLVDGSL